MKVTHRRAKVVAHLMGHCNVGDCGGDVLPVVHQGDDAGVQGLEAAAVVLGRLSFGVDSPARADEGGLMIS